MDARRTGVSTTGMGAMNPTRDEVIAALDDAMRMMSAYIRSLPLIQIRSVAALPALLNNVRTAFETLTAPPPSEGE